MSRIIVHKGRTNIVPVSLGYDVSADTITSEIRSKQDPDSELLATWDVSFATDGTDGEIVLSIDDGAEWGFENTSGFMDLKRVTGGEPVSVFDEPLEVWFRPIITV